MIFSPQELKNMTTSVSSIALEVGEMLAKEFNRNITFEEKTSPHDVVTKFDKESEEIIYKKLKALYPNFGFLGEEKGYRDYIEGEPYWIIDPIDGTLNFANNIPAFAVSIALVYHNKSQLGVCYIPMTKELFTAYKDGGALLNGNKIQPSETKNLDHAIFALPPDQITFKRPDFVVRRQGASVMDICYVAKGAIDGFYDPLLNPWDFAAASLIAEEAGAESFSLKTKSLETNKKSDILVANKNISQDFSMWLLKQSSNLI
ncbi:MAG: 3'(2'),5'-bisphosphate nucleotidase CysQ [Chlamydiia bacterium]|nr:3'(2'),5'-bisphosphate nucleotidase CysQ [Chlamydiia bacterium]